MVKHKQNLKTKLLPSGQTSFGSEDYSISQVRGNVLFLHKNMNEEGRNSSKM